MIELLRRNRRYARLWGGESVSMLGDQVTALALPMIAILLLHAPSWQLGVLTGASWVPYLFGLLTGTVVDRIRTKRLVLVLADLTRALALATIPLAFLLDRHHRLDQFGIVLLVLVAGVVGLAGSVSSTAYVSFFVRIVRDDDVLTANSLNSTARSVTTIGGPPAAGWLIQAVGAPLALIVDSVSYLVSAVTVFGIRTDDPPARHEHQHVLREAMTGLRALIGNRLLAATLLCTTLMNLSNFAVLAVVLVFATRTLHLTAGSIGTAQGIGAFGALVGALSAARLADRIGIFGVAIIGTVMFSLPFFPFAAISATASTSIKIIFYAGCTFLVTGAILLYDITINTVQYKIMPDELRGRLVGAYSSINYGVRPIGAVLGGFAAELWGPRATILAAAGVGLLAVIPLLRSPLRHCRTMADVIEPQPSPVPTDPARG